MLLEALQTQSGASVRQLQRLASTASKRYKSYLIPKRTGGTRLIEHPSRELKSIQRWISAFLFSQFPIHECATAYKKGSNIRKNAEQHVGSNFTLRMDFKDFFPSFLTQDVARFLSNHEISANLNEPDIHFVCNIVTRYGRMTIGAPSSPILTNIMMYDFDKEIFKECLVSGLRYTRYADDLFVSGPRAHLVRGLEATINKVTHAYCHVSLSLNEEKTAHLSRRYNRTITGLVITPDHKISLGRNRKRFIKALIFEYLSGSIAPDKIDKLQGLLAFAVDVEKEFYHSLCEKYGFANVDAILRHTKPGDWIKPA